ncbi:penicillin-binding protein 1A [Leeuwenhoekiella parthenopeia]|uniref:Transglycosylase domain-containing protein n=1 Tax=Leeuwenhoekiella parthenopeia TaxID=2890320 RepID=A0ABS8GQ61_9FLAO|nr:transglycosylase domain-containing protein [Leeuwenhoekiella parthenopeia]MCC4212129.1 transglycosylase domain-containing protein [Leeuwenhoekiella parthenopeia]
MATPKKKVSKNETKSDFSTYIKGFWILFLGGLGALALVFLLASWGVFGKLPTFEELENPESNLATEILSSDGKTLGKFYNENRTPVKYDDLPQNLIDAVVATEDRRFYEHSGIDVRGTARAVAYLGSKGGASTITQQLAKLLFSDEPSNKLERVIQKVKEWIIAARLESQYTKEEIITMYLNKQDFLFQAVGIRSASKIYFDKEPIELRPEESAVIAAMLKNPRQFNPYREISKDKSLERRNTVLALMAETDRITEAEKDSLIALPMKINFSPEGHADGIATYFREYLRAFMADWIQKNPKGKDADGNDEYYNIYRDGLVITTTLDSRMQRFAEQAVTAHMENLQREFDKQNEKNKTAPFRDISEEEEEGIINRAMRNSDRWRKMAARDIDVDQIKASFNQKTDMRVFVWDNGPKEKDTIMTPRDSILYYKRFLRAGLLSMTPQTGEVKAWVGGIDYKHFQYDHVKTGRRQVGSTFKPFLYATAIDQLHLSPCDTIPDNPYCIPAGEMGTQRDWCPANSSGGYRGMVTLKEALANSINTVSARLMHRVGPNTVIDLIKKLGVDTKDIPSVPSIALGTADLSLFEMVSAYSAFANKGVHVEPQIVSTIVDKNGTVLYQSVPKAQDVLSKESAYVTVNLMEGVTQYGSGARLRSGASNDYMYKNVITGHPYAFKNPIAGKTGTTQNQSDGWFMGMVPNLVTGVWVGGDDRSIHFPGIRYGQGATMALPIWGSYMKKCYSQEDLKISQEAFERPEDLSIRIDCSIPAGGSQQTEIPDELDF